MTRQLKQSTTHPPDDDNEEEEEVSLVERVFDHPDVVNEGEYWAIYEFLLNPDIRDDPEMIAGVLREFSGWSQYMLKRLKKHRLAQQIESDKRDRH